MLLAQAFNPKTAKIFQRSFESFEVYKSNAWENQRLNFARVHVLAVLPPLLRDMTTISTC